jgi:hypothetical protein
MDLRNIEFRYYHIVIRRNKIVTYTITVREQYEKQSEAEIKIKTGLAPDYNSVNPESVTFSSKQLNFKG